MTLEDYALIQRELGFIEGITYEIDKNGDIGNSICRISELCEKAVIEKCTELHYQYIEQISKRSDEE